MIQIVAWKAASRSPDMVIDTGGLGLIQSASRANISLIETGGATTDEVFVIVYQKGMPVLALRKTFQGIAKITVMPAHVDLDVDRNYFGSDAAWKDAHWFDIAVYEK